MPNKSLLPEIMAHAKATSGVAFQLRRDPRGVLEVPGLESILVSVHLGPAAQISCRRGGKGFRGRAVHGDIDIIPASTPARWEMHDGNDMALLLILPTLFLRAVARDAGLNDKGIEIVNRFQIRDATLENLGWSIKHELEAGCPSGRLYLDGLAISFASRLLTQHSSHAKMEKQTTPHLAGHRLKQVLSFIEEEIGSDLSLEAIAGVAGVGPSHLQTMFRNALGLSVHQYVIHRRVERAKVLLCEEEMTVVQIAQALGFSDQSHLARQMRRVLNASPSAIRAWRGSRNGSRPAPDPF